MYARRWKRLFDVAVCILLLACLSWLFFLIASLYALTFSYPIIFKQRRIGRNGTTFVLYKFRTLKTTSDSPEQRRFLLGTLLRFTSLDELPQLVNVLRGEMSLIGPRPLPVEYLPLFSVDQMRRHAVLPGITGWAQVNGRNSVPWHEKFALDLYYVDHVSFLLDIRIILRTVMLLLSFRRDVSLKEKKFAGDA